jgi:N-acyl-D-aspartate/D-glutamate deacylase
MRGLPILTIAVVLLGCGTEAARYPLVLRGGRVMDPATGLDSIRDVAIQDGRIVAISSESLDGDSVIDVAGKVVAPGFIDLHAHGQTTGDMQIQARDGVTTALEMEIGVYPVAAWYSSMEGQAPVNYGATVSHVSSRFHVFNGIDVGHWPTNGAKIAALGPRPDGANKAASPAQVDSIAVLLNKGLSEGALGVGLGINYTPAATKEEIATMFRVAKGAGVPAFVHTRAFGIGAIREAIAAAKETGAFLHIVHIGSSALNDMNEVLPLIDSSRAAGMDLTTEVYPYSAASTLIESAMFNPGWEQNLKIGYGEIEWTATGERLTRENVRQVSEGRRVRRDVHDEGREHRASHCPSERHDRNRRDSLREREGTSARCRKFLQGARPLQPGERSATADGCAGEDDHSPRAPAGGVRAGDEEQGTHRNWRRRGHHRVRSGNYHRPGDVRQSHETTPRGTPRDGEWSVRGQEWRTDN